jgi:hypothetical protein
MMSLVYLSLKRKSEGDVGMPFVDMIIIIMVKIIVTIMGHET